MQRQFLLKSRLATLQRKNLLQLFRDLLQNLTNTCRRKNIQSFFSKIQKKTRRFAKYLHIGEFSSEITEDNTKQHRQSVMYFLAQNIMHDIICKMKYNKRSLRILSKEESSKIRGGNTRWHNLSKKRNVNFGKHSLATLYQV